MRLLPLFNRIKKTSSDEILFRLVRAATIFWDRFCEKNNSAPPSLGKIFSTNKEKDDKTPLPYHEFWGDKRFFYFLPEDRHKIGSYIAQHYAEKQEKLYAKAEKICRFEVPLFSRVVAYSENKIKWTDDPITGRSWPMHHWSRISVVGEAVKMDPKYVWELNRHQFLLFPAMAYGLSHQEHFAEFCLDQLVDWIADNPPGQGVNWVESLEVGTRLVAWIWILEFLRGAEALTADKLSSIVVAMHMHARHLSRYLSHYISPNTHLTGEACALLVYSLVYPEDSNAAEWENAARHVLEEELRAQVGEDGVHRELSTAYHTYTFDYYIQYIILDIRQGKKIPESVRNRVEMMAEFILFTERPDGTVPLIGDSDGGFALPLDPVTCLSWKQQLCSAALLFSRPDFKFRSRYLDWSAIWLWGTEALERYSGLEASPPGQTCRHFRDANYIVYRSGWDDQDDYLFFDAGKMGFISAGHSHADYLNFELVLNGKPTISDIGTYSYHDQVWRGYCRATKAHNTVAIDDRDQADPGGSFSWQKLPAKGEGKITRLGGFTLLEGRHAANEGVEHCRVFIVVEEDLIFCFDRFNAQGRHRYEFNYHFDANLSAKMNGQHVTVSNSWHDFYLIPLLFSHQSMKLLRGCRNSLKGYCFPTYGELRSMDTLCLRESITDSFSRGVLFIPAKESQQIPDWSTQTETEDVEGKSFLGQTPSSQYNILVNVRKYLLDTGRKIAIDCDCLIIQQKQSGEYYGFAVGIRDLRVGDKQCLPQYERLTCLLYSQNHKGDEMHFSEVDRVGDIELADDIIIYGLQGVVN